MNKSRRRVLLRPSCKPVSLAPHLLIKGSQQDIAQHGRYDTSLRSSPWSCKPLTLGSVALRDLATPRKAGSATRLSIIEIWDERQPALERAGDGYHERALGGQFGWDRLHPLLQLFELRLCNCLAPPADVRRMATHLLLNGVETHRSAQEVRRSQRLPWFDGRPRFYTRMSQHVVSALPRSANTAIQTAAFHKTAQGGRQTLLTELHLSGWKLEETAQGTRQGRNGIWASFIAASASSSPTCRGLPRMSSPSTKRGRSQMDTAVMSFVCG